MIAKSVAAAGLALLLASFFADPAGAADAAAGQRLAQQWCANCHLIDGVGRNATVPQGPPAFRTVAQQMTAAQMRVFLSHPHPPMPDLALTRAEIDNLTAYILSLR
jgi:mono/diheme cytochrome c family protein